MTDKSNTETPKSPARRKQEEAALRKRNIKNKIHERRLARKKDEVCAYCKYRGAVTMEHFIPQSSGLEIAFRRVNIIPACRECNGFKGGRWPNDKEIAWFFKYWEKQLQDVESYLKIAEAIKRNRHGSIPENKQEVVNKKPKRRRRRRPRHRL